MRLIPHPLRTADLAVPVTLRAIVPRETVTSAAGYAHALMQTVRDPRHQSHELFERQGGVNLTRFMGSRHFQKIISTAENIVRYPCRIDHCSVRLQECRENRELPWHQDVVAMAEGSGRPVESFHDKAAVVGWFPLNDIGSDCPSLMWYWPDDPIDVLHHVKTEEKFLKVSQELVLLDERRFVVNDMSIGDMLLFSPYTLHRTYSHNGMINPRMSIDLRFYEE